MTNEQILRLVEAGFTADEIRAIAAVQSPGNPSHDEQQEQPEQKLIENTQQIQDDKSELLSAIKEMGNSIVSALQRAQIGGSYMQAPQKEETIESMVASIINPYENKEV